MYRDGVIYIFNLEVDDEFSRDFKTYIESIRGELIDYFTYKPKYFENMGVVGKDKQEEIIRTNTYRFVPIRSRDCPQTKALEYLSNAKKKLKN